MPPGTDVETFKTDLVESAFTGGPIPDYFVNNAGVIGHGMITLDAGEYIVSFDLASNLDHPSTAEDLVTAPLTVGPGDDDAVIPETDGGAIRAGDYLFDVDVAAGGSTVTFTNSSDNQFHHVVVMDFGTNDPTVVEENFLALLEAEDESAMPEGIDPAQINFEFASSGVFGPGGSGTFDAAFEAGHTYAAMCFIQDRLGGQPHVFQHNMYEVFQLDAPSLDRRRGSEKPPSTETRRMASQQRRPSSSSLSTVRQLLARVTGTDRRSFTITDNVADIKPDA